MASDWLIDQVEELSGRSCFPEEQVQSVAFIKEMEKLGSLPAARCAADSAAHRYRGCTPRHVAKFKFCISKLIFLIIK